MSGASFHVTSNKGYLSNFREEKDEIITADGAPVAVVGKGDIEFTAFVEGKCKSGTLTDVRYAPTFCANLLSTSVIDKHGCRVEQESGALYIMKDGKVWITGRKKNGQSLFTTTLQMKIQQLTAATVAASGSLSVVRLWHERLGHASRTAMSNLIKQGLLKEISEQDLKKFFCEACAYGKQTRLNARFRRSRSEITNRVSWYMVICADNFPNH